MRYYFYFLFFFLPPHPTSYLRFSVTLKLTSGAIILLFLKIRRSQHAFINPAITIILRMGAGGHGVPPLGSPDG